MCSTRCAPCCHAVVELLHCAAGALAQDAATGTAAASDPIANHHDSVTASKASCLFCFKVCDCQPPTAFPACSTTPNLVHYMQECSSACTTTLREFPWHLRQGSSRKLSRLAVQGLAGALQAAAAQTSVLAVLLRLQCYHTKQQTQC